MPRCAKPLLHLLVAACWTVALATPPPRESTPKWNEFVPGVWAAKVGRPDDLTPLRVVGAVPRVEGLAALPRLRPEVLDGIRVDRGDGRVVIRAPLAPDEKIFGLGLQFMRVNHRGYTRQLRVNSDPVQDTGESHAPAPFYVSSRGYGLLVDASRIVSVYCGSTVRADSAHPPEIRDRGRDDGWAPTPRSDVIELVLSGDAAEILVFAGPSMLEAVRRYNLFNGGGPIPPRWGLGFWHRVNTRFSDEQVLEEAAEFRKRGFPCDVIGLEPGWHSKSYPCTYEWGRDRFPDPAGFVRRMEVEGFHVNLWEHPYVSPDAPIYGALKPYGGSHTVWAGLAPDYSIPAARRILMGQHDQAHVAIGVSGYKLDECDGSELTPYSWMFPAHAHFPSGHDGEQLRQVYGLLFQRMTADVFHQRNRRTYGLVRASNAGATSLPYVLYSDLYDHRQFVRALCNSSFSGLLWTPEIRSAGGAEEWVRRMQVVCFSPLAMLNAWSSSLKPWSFPEVEGIIRDQVEWRMRLLPYYYNAFARYHFDGTPPFRALALALSADEVGRDPGLLEIDDEYMAGDSLLVAPLFAGQSGREAYLPEGGWRDFWSGNPVEGGRRIKVEPGLARIPVYVREGAIIPLMPASAHAPRPGGATPLELRHFGDKAGRVELYDDDGETFDYERGSFQIRVAEASKDGNGVWTGRVSNPKSGAPSTFGPITWTFPP
jgi:alpha-glucosidase (family GH31 glycosyl hydrolase)